MPLTGPAPPRVSRETRLLLVIALASLVALGILARFRFPDRTISPNPLPSVLTQLAPRPAFDEVPSLIADLGTRLGSSLVALPVEAPRVSSPPQAHGHALVGLRVREEIAVALVDDLLAGPGGLPLVARDAVSGLAAIRVAPRSAPDIVAWSPRRVDYPRYLVASEAIEDLISLRPVFVGSLVTARSPRWPDPLWAAPVRTDLAAGTFVFTTEGVLAGLVVERDGRPAIVPGYSVLSMAERLLLEPQQPAGRLGVEVQFLAPAIAAAAGAPHGVVVTWVDPGGPAAGQLTPTDIIEAAAGSPVVTLEDWQARVGRLTAGESLELRVRRTGERRTVHLRAGAGDRTAADLPHGLTMRTLPGVGVEVLRVQTGSASARAGVKAGDVITVVGGVESPTPAQLSRAFAAAPADRPVLVAIARGDTHLVLTLGRQ